MNRRWLPFLVSVLFYAILLAVALLRMGPLTHGISAASIADPPMLSSSIVWPILLNAAGNLFGPGPLLPLILNISFGVLFLALIQYILNRSDVRSWIWQTLTLMLLVLVFPMVAMTIDGTEYIFYGFAFVLFLWCASVVLDKEKRVTPLQAPVLLLSALLLTGCRYEGIFAVFITCLFLAWRSRALAVATALAGLIPFLGFGLYSHSHGGMWLPGSPVFAGNSSFLLKIFAIPRVVLSLYPWESGLAGLFIFVFCLGILGRRGGLSNIQRYLIFLYLGCVVLHVQFVRLQPATPGYESYLIGAGVLLASLGLYSIKRFENERQAPLLFSLKLIAALVLLPLLGYRGIRQGMVSIPDDTPAIHNQQSQ